jgi:hypothetical protein
MRRKLSVLISFLLVVALAGQVSAAVLDWRGGTDSDWLNAANWVTGASGVPTSGDWADIRSAAWVPNQPIITAGQTAVCGNLRINAYGAGALSTVTVDGGTLDIYKEAYIGNAGTGELILNSGEVSVGVGGTNAWTFAGVDASFGVIRLNDGIFNAGILGIPRWYGAPSAGGHVYIDGGQLNFDGIIFTDGVDGQIEFTSNLADGGGMMVSVADMNDVDFSNWQDTIQNWLDTDRIVASASYVQVDYESVGDLRTTTIYSVPEPTTIALLGLGASQLIRRRRRK